MLKEDYQDLKRQIIDNANNGTKEKAFSIINKSKLPEEYKEHYKKVMRTLPESGYSSREIYFWFFGAIVSDQETICL